MYGDEGIMRYEFLNTETGEYEEHIMPWQELDQFKEDNPHLQKVISAPAIVSGNGGVRNDNGWKENMARIAEAHPGTPLADRYGKKSDKEIKTRNVLKKHGIIE
jgi:hypothetical protein